MYAANGSEAGNGAAGDQNNGLLSEIFGDRKERTLTGCLIGSVRDVFSGSLSQEEAAQRAQSNDFMATIAADTVAMMAKRAGAGSVARAVMLADTQGDIRDVGLGLVKDGLEGFALNKIGKFGMGRTADGRVGAYLGRGLKGEARTHALSGAMFGAVKAAGDPMAWRDESGHFSVISGLSNLTDYEKMLKATAVGAVANVPAGMLGTRVAQSLTARVAQSTGMARLGMVSGGVVSGAGSGGLFGGIDAAVRGGGLSEIAAATRDGAYIGAFTGGVMSGYHSIKSGPELAASLGLRRENMSQASERLLRSVTQVETEIAAATRDGRGRIKLEPWHSDSPRMQKIFEAVEYVPREKQNVSSLSRRLFKDRVEPMEFRQLKDPKQKTVRAENWSEFLKHTETVKRDAVVYTIDGLPVEIVVPKQYADKLAMVRRLRQISEIEVPAFDNLDSQSRIELSHHLKTGNYEPLRQAFGKDFDRVLPVLQARERIVKDSFSQRALPEDMIPLIEELPNPSLVKRVVLLDEPYYGDAHVVSGKGKGKGNSASTEQQSIRRGEAAATADSTGEITFYKAMNGQLFRTAHSTKLREYMLHEWAHLVKYRLKEHSRLFNDAADIEANGWYAREYAKKQYPDQPDLKDHENFAVHLGENLIPPDGDSFLMTAQNAPIRTAIMARAWLESMIPQTGEHLMHPARWGERFQHIPKDVPYRQAYIERLKYVADEVVPLARQRLVDIALNPKSKDQGKAAELLGVIGHKDDVASLYTMAKRPGEFADRQTAYRAAVRLVSTDPAQQFDFLVSTAKSGSPVRELALDALKSSNDHRAHNYRRFFELENNPDRLPELIAQIDMMPDLKGRQMAFQEVVRLASEGQYAKDFTSSFIKGIVDRHPDLRPDALRVIGETLDMSYEPVLRKLRYSKDRGVASEATRHFNELKIRSDIERYRRWLEGSSDVHKKEAIDGLAYLGDHRAVQPLLEVVGGKDPKWAREALTALTHYSPNIVESYAHRMQGRGEFPLTWGDVKKKLDAPTYMFGRRSS